MTFRAMPDGNLEYEPMAAADLESMRKRWDLSRVRFGEYLGYTGEHRNIYMTVKRMETGAREIPPMVERLATMLSWFHSDHGYLPDLDNCERRPRLEPAAIEPDDARLGVD